MPSPVPFDLPSQVFPCHAGIAPLWAPPPTGSSTILQHLAPQRIPLSRKFHTFHLSAICRVFREMLLFAGLAEGVVDGRPPARLWGVTPCTVIDRPTWVGPPTWS